MNSSQRSPERLRALALRIAVFAAVALPVAFIGLTGALYAAHRAGLLAGLEAQLAAVISAPPPPPPPGPALLALLFLFLLLPLLLLAPFLFVLVLLKLRGCGCAPARKAPPPADLAKTSAMVRGLLRLFGPFIPDEAPAAPEKAPPLK